MLKVICINEQFSPDEKGATKFLEKAKQKLAENPGEPTILLFPEAVFRRFALPRAFIKTVTRELHALAAQHGNALIAFSAIEKTPWRKRGFVRLSNTGYLVSTKNGNNAGYQAYPKIASYSHGTALTDFDNTINFSPSTNPTAQSAIDSIVHWTERAKRVRRFPSIMFNGQKVGLSVCADSAMEPNQDFHQANNEKFDLLLVPAVQLDFDKERIRELQKRLTPNGTAIIMDERQGQKYIHATGNKVMEIHSRVLIKRPQNRDWLLHGVTPLKRKLLR